ncbi:hypothetical protein KUC47_13595 [Pseudomonas aeruginosa]|uniref:hypothetical protein n=1 Tax=Pseudomonas aeruginosa TaxID=287 RepID=UPI0021E2996F|nr:hypothetical protein [Pseudomonas aeruginosa]MCV0161016.1 hypothetical protein [Pseudomonas aeruginosa]
MSIDWSKAPEGANKAGFTGPDNYLQFYRIPGMFGDYDYWSDGRGWLGSNFPTCANQLFERPAKVEWDGKGLPPVGAKCLTDRNDFLREVTILCHGKTRTFVFDHVSQEEICLVLKDRVFLPIRTPEQIAAEEREKAIEEMCFAEETLTVKQAKALYEAGYRRQEEGK